MHHITIEHQIAISGWSDFQPSWWFMHLDSQALLFCWLVQTVVKIGFKAYYAKLVHAVTQWLFETLDQKKLARLLLYSCIICIMQNVFVNTGAAQSYWACSGIWSVTDSETAWRSYRWSKWHPNTADEELDWHLFHPRGFGSVKCSRYKSSCGPWSWHPWCLHS